MAAMHRTLSAAAGALLLVAAGCATTPRAADSVGAVWVAAWASAQQEPEPRNALPDEALDDATLRQIVRVSLGGTAIRVRLSNAFGRTALRVDAAHVARAVGPGDSAIVAGTDRALTFSGREDVVIPAGADVLSDPLDMPVAAFDDLAVSIHLPAPPAPQTGHPGSRTTSFVSPGAHVADAALADARTVEHWYQLSGVEVAAPPGAVAIAVIGDSITDGRGSTTNGDDRWTDFLARRLQADPATARYGVLNLGIGGGRLLEDGLGPNALARLDRDVIARPGVETLIVLIGVNDLGVLSQSPDADADALDAMADRIIAGYEQIVRRARARGIAVYVGAVTAYGGASVYRATPASEAARAKINAWVRGSGAFDGVIDFDAVTRDPRAPDRLNPAYDSGDHLHPSPAGFAAMADAAAEALFPQARRGGKPIRRARSIPLDAIAG